MKVLHNHIKGEMLPEILPIWNQFGDENIAREGAGAGVGVDGGGGVNRTDNLLTK